MANVLEINNQTGLFLGLVFVASPLSLFILCYILSPLSEIFVSESGMFFPEFASADLTI